ncbi:hypothetical protein J6590_042224 [Homalodisca vitripennis]|nr:hypothetical protein J6590_042224 [Homalodisca vitripennis]
MQKREEYGENHGHTHCKEREIEYIEDFQYRYNLAWGVQDQLNGHDSEASALGSKILGIFQAGDWQSGGSSFISLSALLFVRVQVLTL